METKKDKFRKKTYKKTTTIKQAASKQKNQGE